jgi:hypothetical protein
LFLYKSFPPKALQNPIYKAIDLRGWFKLARDMGFLQDFHLKSSLIDKSVDVPMLYSNNNLPVNPSARSPILQCIDSVRTS